MKLRNLAVCILILFPCFLVGCALYHHEDIGEYKFANYDDYNSYAKDNGLGGNKIYVVGTMEEAAYVGDDEDIAYSLLTQVDGKVWVVLLDKKDNFDKSLFDRQLVNTPVTVCGEYQGFSTVLGYPALFAEKYVGNSGTISRDTYYVESPSSTEEAQPSVFIEGTTEISEEYKAYMQNYWGDTPCSISYGFSADDVNTNMSSATSIDEKGAPIIIELDHPDTSDAESFVTKVMFSTLSVAVDQLQGAPIDGVIVKWGDEYILSAGTALSAYYIHHFDMSGSNYAELEKAYRSYADTGLNIRD